jgi:hypothetical protein
MKPPRNKNPAGIKINPAGTTGWQPKAGDWD